MADAQVAVVVEKGKGKGKKENWRDCEIEILIQIWRDNMDDLRRTKRNRIVYQKMAESLKDCGYTRSWDSIQRKVKNLTAEFRKEKCIIGPSGGARSKWRFFSAINEILGCLPVNNDDLMHESITIETINPENNLHSQQPPHRPPSAIELLNEMSSGISDSFHDVAEYHCEGTEIETPSTSNSEDTSKENNSMSATSLARKKFLERKNRKGTSSKAAVVELLEEFKHEREEMRKDREELRKSDEKFHELLEQQTNLFSQSVDLQRNFNTMFGNYLSQNSNQNK